MPGGRGTSRGMSWRGSARHSWDAPDLITTDEIAARVISAKGFEATDSTLRAAIRDQLLTVLRAARKRGTVEPAGLGRGVRWKLARAGVGSMINPSRGERDADVSLVDIKACRFVGKELIRERVVEQRGRLGGALLAMKAVLVEVKSGNLSTIAAGRPTKKTAPSGAARRRGGTGPGSARQMTKPAHS